MINVLIVEDQKLARENMEIMINASKKYTLAGSIKNARDAGFFCMRKDVDLILMDVCTEHNESGITATAKIKKDFPNIKVIIVTSMVEHSFIKKAKKAGADSFWYKDVSEETLLSVMDKTMEGKHVFPEKTPEIELGITTSYELTERELEVLRAIMTSVNDQDAATQLNCTVDNIRFHLKQVLCKTGHASRMEPLLDIAAKHLIIVHPNIDT